MVEIKTNIESIQKIVHSGINHLLFESNDTVIFTGQGIFLRAKKRSKAKVFSNSYPLYSLGYSGISGVDFSKDENFSELEFVLNNISDLEKKDLLKVKNEVEKLLSNFD